MLTPKKKLALARTRLRQTQKVARAKNKVSKAVNKGKIAEMYGGNKTASGSVMKAKADIKLDKANNRLKKVTANTTTKPAMTTKPAVTTKPATKRIPMKATPKSIPSAKRSLSIPKKISANTISSTNSKVRKRKK